MCLEKIKKYIADINEVPYKVNIMEVCGTHTSAISNFGLRKLFSNNINLISGPGCPVCVTPDKYIDYIYNLSMEKEVVITTFGDMIRVPGSEPNISLEKAKAKGAKVKMVYSSFDAVEFAKENPGKKVIFLGIGFETTAPTTAISLKYAKEQHINNFFVLSMHKKVEPVMKELLDDDSVPIDGFLCPGHVAAVVGEKGFEFLKEYNCSGVIAGFDMESIVKSIYLLTTNNKLCILKNCYKNVVPYEGNVLAIKLMKEVFNEENDLWRGLGNIECSGLKLKNKYSNYDAFRHYPMTINKVKNKTKCSCGDVLKGKIKPNQCLLFKKICTPENPIGPCMVSSEGSCAAYYNE